MKSFTTVMLVLCTTIISIPETFAQDYIPIFSQNYGSRLSLEIDPITFLFRGYSLHVRYQPMFSQRLLIGAGTYALDLPDAIVDLNHENRDIGWEARIRSAFMIYGEFYAKKANHGWFIGEQIGFQSLKVSIAREQGGSTSFNNLVLMTYGGYSWHPYKGSFYIKPWLGLGYTRRIDGINRIGPMQYDIAPLLPFFTLHAGYTF